MVLWEHVVGLSFACGFFLPVEVVWVYIGCCWVVVCLLLCFVFCEFFEGVCHMSVSSCHPVWFTRSVSVPALVDTPCASW